MKMDRSKIFRAAAHDEDDGYVDADMATRLLMMRDITRDAWAFTGGAPAEGLSGAPPRTP